MTDSSSNSKTDGYEFPFQFMLDARSTPMNWENPSKRSSTGVLSPFQWSPTNPSTRPKTFTGDITGFYHGPSIFQDDDSFSFFDQSFFFMDQVDHTYASGSGQQRTAPHPTIRRSQHRVSFSSRLTKCHRQRMSTIAESPVPEEDSSTEEEEEAEEEEEDGLSHEAGVGSSIASQLRWDFPVEPPQTSSIVKKLLDYIVPYPTRPMKRKAGKQKQRKLGAPLRVPRSLSIRTTASASSCSTDSECSSLGNEEWVAHGFFEIHKGL